MCGRSTRKARLVMPTKRSGGVFFQVSPVRGKDRSVAGTPPFSGLNVERSTSNIEHWIENSLPAEGLEPTRPCGHWILSPARLPIPPRRRYESKRYEIPA